MKKLPIVFKFEFFSIVKKRGFRIATIIMVVLFLAISFIPKIISAFGNKDGDLDKETKIKYGIVYLDKDIDKAELAKYPPFDMVKEFDTKESLNSKISEDEIDAGIVLIKADNFNYIIKDQGLNMRQLNTFSEALKLFNRNEMLKKENISLEVVDRAENIEINSEITVLGKSSMKNTPMTYIGIILMYTLIITYGSIIATAVAKEKSNRTMELLITSCNASSLIVGKVLASMASILIQVTAIAIAIIAGIMINKSSFSPAILDAIAKSINLSSVFTLLSFCILGFLMYAFLFAALGALVSKVEDVNASIAPVTFIFVASYIIAMIGIASPTNIVFRVASIVPFTAPLCMFVRSTLTSVTIAELSISVALILLTTIALAWLSIKIYRMGTLNYGNKIGIFKAIKMVFSK